MKTKTPTVNTPPRFFLQLLFAAALMAVIAPITAVADNLCVSANQDGSIFEYAPWWNPEHVCLLLRKPKSPPSGIGF